MKKRKTRRKTAKKRMPYKKMYYGLLGEVLKTKKKRRKRR